MHGALFQDKKYDNRAVLLSHGERHSNSSQRRVLNALCPPRATEYLAAASTLLLQRRGNIDEVEQGRWQGGLKETN